LSNFSARGLDLKNIIKELVLITKPQMNAHGILLEFKCEEGDFIINTVASYVKQILISLLANAKDELIDYAIRTGAPMEVVENLQEIEDEGDMYESIDEIWPDYPSEEDYLWNEDEY